MSQAPIYINDSAPSAGDLALGGLAQGLIGGITQAFKKQRDINDFTELSYQSLRADPTYENVPDDQLRITARSLGRVMADPRTQPMAQNLLAGVKQHAQLQRQAAMDKQAGGVWRGLLANTEYADQLSGLDDAAIGASARTNPSMFRALLPKAMNDAQVDSYKAQAEQRRAAAGASGARSDLYKTQAELLPGLTQSRIDLNTARTDKTQAEADAIPDLTKSKIDFNKARSDSTNIITPYKVDNLQADTALKGARQGQVEQRTDQAAEDAEFKRHMNDLTLGIKKLQKQNLQQRVDNLEAAPENKARSETARQMAKQLDRMQTTFSKAMELAAGSITGPNPQRQQQLRDMLVAVEPSIPKDAPFEQVRDAFLDEMRGLQTRIRKLTAGQTSGAGQAEQVQQPDPDAVAKPQNEAEYNALPPGTRYVHPDGSVRVKKGKKTP